MNIHYNNLTRRQQTYVDAVRVHGPDLGVDITKEEYSRAELRPVSLKMKGKVWIPNWITHDQSRRVARGVFRIPEIALGSTEDAKVAVPDVMSMVTPPAEVAMA